MPDPLLFLRQKIVTISDVAERPLEIVQWLPLLTPLSHVDRPQPERDREVYDMELLRRTVRFFSSKEEQASEIREVLKLEPIEGTRIVDIDPQTAKYVADAIRDRQEAA